MTKESRKDLVLEHSRLVDDVLKMFNGKGVEPDDLKQEGFLGLCEAASRADAAFTLAQFRTFAVWRIRYAMARAVHRRGLINRSRAERKLYSQCMRAVESLMLDGNTLPSFAEIAEVAKVTPDQVCEAFSAPGRSSADVAQVVDSERRVHDDDIFDAIDQALSNLAMADSLAYRVVCMWFGLRGFAACTRSRIAVHLCVPMPEVSNLKSRALRVLKDALEGQGFNQSQIATIFTRHVA